MKSRFGDDVRFKVYGPRRGILQRFAASAIDETVLNIEERAQYARFGL